MTGNAGKSKPVLFTLDEDDAPDVAEAPVLPDETALPLSGQAMQHAVQIAAKPPSRLARWFWGLLLTLIGAVVSIAAWQFATGLVAEYPILGIAISVLLAGFVLVSLIIAIKELFAFSRLRRVDALHRRADQVLADESVEGARRFAKDVLGLYRDRDEMRWGAERLHERLDDSFDASAVLSAVEQELLAPLDAAAQREVEAAARQVATVTALVPLALADVVAALVSNLRMIRRIAEIYAGRSGTLGSWRLTRAVMAHLVATGAVAVGDDLIGSLAGGSIVGKVSRRFGEGLVNGALTARVGVAAMEVCRPMAFSKGTRPSVSRLVKRALTGLFGN